jgi:integrase
MKIDSAKRNLNDVKAVISLAIKEHELDISNRFAKLDFPKQTEAAIDQRHPLPEPIILAMYEALSNNGLLLDIWAFIHHTGAQNAEILGLKAKNIHLSSDVPHIEIKPEGDRSVKTLSRIRKVPLVGLALKVAERLCEESKPEQDLFPKYADTSKHDNFSQAVRNRLRKHTDNPKHAIYSLRHNMKDALRQNGGGERIEHAVLGHATERGSAGHYGSAVTLQEMQSIMLRIKFSVPE